MMNHQPTAPPPSIPRGDTSMYTRKYVSTPTLQDPGGFQNTLPSEAMSTSAHSTNPSASRGSGGPSIGPASSGT